MSSPASRTGAAARYHLTDVPVAGGFLRVGIWEPVAREDLAREESVSEDPASLDLALTPALLAPAPPTVLALHGVTASHLAWQLLAEALPGVRIIAPDLRGRGRSNTLPGPFGLAAHAEDMAAVLRELGPDAGADGARADRAGAHGTGPVVVVGHSMGAFVAVELARRFPQLVAGLVLVDGGLPLRPPPGLAESEVTAAALGPAAERLGMTFASVQEYRDFWHRHPAFTPWNDAMSAYVDYDLVGQAPRLHPAANPQAVEEDTGQLYNSRALTEALAGVLAALPGPAILLRAPRGLFNDAGGLYPDEHVADCAVRLASRGVPALRVENAGDVNHYTIVLSESGAARVAAAVGQALASGRRPAGPEAAGPAGRETA